MGILNLCIF